MRLSIQQLKLLIDEIRVLVVYKLPQQRLLLQFLTYYRINLERLQNINNQKIFNRVSSYTRVCKLKRLMLLQSNTLSIKVINSLSKLSNIFTYYLIAIYLEINKNILDQISVILITSIIKFFKRYIYIIYYYSRVNLQY